MTTTADQKVGQELRGYWTNLQFHKDNSARLIRFSKPLVTDEHLKQIRGFKNLEYLAIVCPLVTDDGFSVVAELKKLQTLVLSETKVTDTGLKSLSGLTELQNLYLDHSNVGDEGLKYVASLTNLKTLSLANTKITTKGLAHLAKIESLETLILDGTEISGEGRTSDEGLVQLGELSNLRVLSLQHTSVESLPHFSSLVSLESLRLNQTLVDDKVFQQAAEIPSLKSLQLAGTKVTRDSVDAYRENHPKQIVFTDKPNQSNDNEPAKSDSEEFVANAEIEPSIKGQLNDESTEPDFQRHVIPILGRLGCNSRNCHGSFQGKGGFRLSMFGYDFDEDHKNLSERVDTDDVEESLILHKPTSDDNHEGGKRFEEDSWQQNLLRRWIVGGAKGITDPEVKFARLEVTPAEIVFSDTDNQKQLNVVAVWSNGLREDVTCLTRFETKDDSVADVDAEGLVTSVGKGDTHVIVSYDNGIVPVPIVLAVSELAGDRFPEVATPTRLDELVIERLRPLGIVPSEKSTDEMFLRRVSLDIAGTLPSPDEIREFVADERNDKRAKKIDELIGRDSYVSWWTNLLCDLTGSNAGYLGDTEMARPISQQWQAWIEKRVRENIGWDEIARDIITATSRRPGESYSEFIVRQSSYTKRGSDEFSAIGNPMPHFWHRSNLRIPSDRTLGFGYTFMGLKLDCAQCHKHPFDQWSKQDFDLFTEFFTRIKVGQAPDAAEQNRQMRDKLAVPTILNTAALRRQSYLRIAAEGRPIPWNEVYMEKPRDKPQLARLLGGAEVDLSQFDDPREVLFNWLINEPNRYFAKSFVNRVWAHYFNVGIVDPPDDLNLANPPSNAALLDHLAEQFIENGYDMRWLHRTITNSDTYQRSWLATPSNELDERHFSHSVVRRLPAEVAIDAVIQATANDKTLTRLHLDVKSRKVAQHPLSYQTRSIDYSLLVFGKSLRSTNCDCERKMKPTLVQALFLRNDEDTLKWLDRSDGWLKQIGSTPDDATDISPDDIAATLYHAIGIDPMTEYHTPQGRPITLVPDGRVMKEVFG